MSTKYILAGGADVKKANYWVDLRLALSPVGSPKVLSCQFSHQEHEWQERFESFIPYFKIAFGANMVPTLADAGYFSTQVREADIVYLHGGNTDMLISALDKIDNVAQLFQEKIIIGSSAGAQFISQKYWTCSGRNRAKRR